MSHRSGELAQSTCTSAGAPWRSPRGCPGRGDRRSARRAGRDRGCSREGAVFGGGGYRGVPIRVTDARPCGVHPQTSRNRRRRRAQERRVAHGAGQPVADHRQSKRRMLGVAGIGHRQRLKHRSFRCAPQGGRRNPGRTSGVTYGDDTHNHCRHARGGSFRYRSPGVGNPRRVPRACQLRWMRSAAGPQGRLPPTLSPASLLS